MEGDIQTMAGVKISVSPEAAGAFRELQARLRAVDPRLSQSQVLELLVEAWRRQPLTAGEILGFPFRTPDRGWRRGRPRGRKIQPHG